MFYKLRFIQHFKQSDTDRFMELEKKFMALEKLEPTFPKGRRFTPVFGKEPMNTLIWESEFTSMEEAVGAQQFLENNNLHKELFDQQVQYFIDSYSEIYKALED